VCPPLQRRPSHHSSLPEDAHAVLDAGQAVGDLGEVVLAHGALLHGERPVVGRHGVQGVAAGRKNRHELGSGRLHFTRVRGWWREGGRGGRSSLPQQAHHVIGGVGVQAQRRHGDVGGGVRPVLMVVLYATQHGVGRGRLRVDHFA